VLAVLICAKVSRFVSLELELILSWFTLIAGPARESLEFTKEQNCLPNKGRGGSSSSSDDEPLLRLKYVFMLP
jgi:hypothetical protein